jgi:hypothetical protein
VTGEREKGMHGTDAQSEARGPSSDAYRATWSRLRNLRAVVLLSWIAWIPANVLAERAGPMPLVGVPWLWVTIPACVVGFVGGGLAIALLRCPRCRKRFACRDWFSPTRGWSSNPWTRRCLNCGLSQWSDPVADDEAARGL